MGVHFWGVRFTLPRVFWGVGDGFTPMTSLLANSESTVVSKLVFSAVGFAAEAGGGARGSVSTCPFCVSSHLAAPPRGGLWYIYV